ncbi:MAG: hypothetical protein ACOY5B_06680 [Spirochaetota bacterium]
MKTTKFILIVLTALWAASLFAEGKVDAVWIKPQAGIVNAWKTDFPIMDGVAEVSFSKSDASLMYVVQTKNAPETVQAIATFYKGKKIGKFTVGDFIARDDFMPDAVGFTAGKKPRGQGLAIFAIPQGTSVIVYIHPHRK